MSRKPPTPGPVTKSRRLQAQAQALCRVEYTEAPSLLQRLSTLASSLPRPPTVSLYSPPPLSLPPLQPQPTLTWRSDLYRYVLVTT
jgi:hypothetical protein